MYIQTVLSILIILMPSVVYVGLLLYTSKTKKKEIVQINIDKKVRNLAYSKLIDTGAEVKNSKFCYNFKFKNNYNSIFKLKNGSYITIKVNKEELNKPELKSYNSLW